MTAKSPKAKSSIDSVNYLSDESLESSKTKAPIPTIKLNGHALASKSENQQGETEARLRLAVEASDMGCWDWNIKTDEVVWESKHESLIDEPTVETCESFKAFMQQVHPEDREIVASCFKQAMGGNIDCEVEFRFTRRYDLTRWLYMRCCAVFSNDAPTKIIGVVQDITEKKTAEVRHEKLIAEAQAAQIEIEQAKKAKEEFLITVSHELRTPLTSIVGWSHLIRWAEMSREEIEYALSVIERNAIAQKSLIEDLLDRKRAINRNMNLNLQQVKLSTVVEAALEIVRPSAEAKKLSLNYSCDTLQDQIICDPTWLRQAVLNLLTNAVECTSKGHIEVRVEVEATGNQRIDVRDTGKGIEAERLPFVFDNLRQTKSKQNGDSQAVSEMSGLATTLHIVKLHGGTVEAFSEGEEKGSTFTLSLPVNAPASTQFEDNFLEGVDWVTPSAQSAFRNISEEKELKDLRVLVVDDDISTSKLFEFVMAHCGAKVKSCSSAAEAMQTLEKWQPDALVCDIGMPDIDGYTLINLIRNLPTSQSSIPAIAVTAFASEETQRRALEAGFQEYIAKPVLPEELAKAVRTIVGSKQHNYEDRKSDNLITQPAIVAVPENKLSKTIANNVREVAAKNCLLKALPQEEYGRLEPYMTVVTLKSGDVLCEPDEFIKYVYFPINSVASLLSITDDGTSIEAGMVGREGIVGLPVILGFDMMSTWASMTIGGRAIRIGSKQLKSALQTSGKLHYLALDYTRAFITQISQTAVCNRRHSVEERLCTWLLLLHDCLGLRKLPLTQELISNRLGTRRPGISNCTRDLQKAGLIQSERGRIYIKDKEALEATACSCYEVIKAEYESLYYISRDANLS